MRLTRSYSENLDFCPALPHAGVGAGLNRIPELRPSAWNYRFECRFDHGPSWVNPCRPARIGTGVRSTHATPSLVPIRRSCPRTSYSAPQCHLLESQLGCTVSHQLDCLFGITVSYAALITARAGFTPVAQLGIGTGYAPLTLPLISAYSEILPKDLLFCPAPAKRGLSWG